MSVHSKIASPEVLSLSSGDDENQFSSPPAIYVSSGSDEARFRDGSLGNWSLSPPDYNGHHDRHRLHTRNSVIPSGSASRNSRYSASGSAPIRHSRHLLAPTSHQNQRSRHYVSRASPNHAQESREVLSLRAENITLKHKMERLQARLEASVYVFTILHYAHNTYEVFRDAYNRLLDSLGQKIDTTKEDVKNMIQQMSIKTGVEIPGIPSSEISLAPRAEDYPKVRYWKSAPWRELRNKAGPRLDPNAPILCLFLEDALGRPIGDDVKSQVLSDMAGIWRDLSSKGQLATYTQLGFTAREEFRKTIESKHPFLRLCEGNWKSAQLWINYFRWPTPPPTSKKGGKPAPVKEETPIDISSDVNNAPTGSKRGRQDVIDSEAGPSKKRKGKDRDPEVVGFHHARPKPKKTGAKIAKVSIFMFLFCLCLLRRSRATYCTLFFYCARQVGD